MKTQTNTTILPIKWKDEHHADAFERLITENKIQYNLTLKPNWLDTQSRIFLSVIEEDEYRLGNILIQDPDYKAPPSLSLKILKPELYHYFEIYPLTGQFLFIADQEHHESRSFDFIMANRLAQKSNMPVRSIETPHGSILETPLFKFIDTRTKQDREEQAQDIMNTWK